jgi:hypothetical protein
MRTSEPKAALESWISSVPSNPKFIKRGAAR